VAAIVLGLAAIIWVVSLFVSHSVPAETGLVLYWPYLVDWYVGLLPYLCLPLLFVGLAAFIAVRQLRAGTRGIVHAIPVVGFLASAAVICFCSFSLSFLDSYGHIASTQVGMTQYQIGRTSDADALGDYLLCTCDRYSFMCRCQRIHTAGWVDPPIRITVAETGSVTVLLGDEVIFAGTPAGP